MEDFILFFIRDLLFEYAGISIRWIFFLGKKKINELKGSKYNIIVSIIFYLLLIFFIILYNAFNSK